MSFKRFNGICLALLFVTVFTLVACQPTSPSSPAPTLSPSPSPATTQPITTPSPSPSLTPVPTLTPTPTPKPTPTLTPTPTSTPTPTPTPTTTPPPSPTTTRLDIIDQHALNAPTSAEGNVASLAAYLVQPAQNDTEKARAIYRWITKKITYDVAAFFTSNFPSQSPASVLARRTAVCQGYSELFEALAKAAGITVVFIGGWAKGYGFHVGDGLDKATDHAWNAVKIDGTWRLLDSTWGGGYIDTNKNYVPEFNDYYFLTPPERFIYTHLPEEQQWQVISPPYSQAQYLGLPLVKAHFFKIGLQFGNYTQGIISVNRDLAVIIQAPTDVLLSATLEQGGAKLSRALTFIQREGTGYKIEAVFPAAGDYILTIYAKRTADAGAYWQAVDYQVRVSQNPTGPIGFPEIYQEFVGRGAYLYAPKTAYLPSGTTQTFKLDVPGAEEVVVIVNDQWYDLTKQGQTFEGTANVAPGQVSVAAKFPGKEDYSVLLRYTGS